MSLGNLKYVKTLRQNLEVKTEATNSKPPMCNLKKTKDLRVEKSSPADGLLYTRKKQC